MSFALLVGCHITLSDFCDENCFGLLCLSPDQTDVKAHSLSPPKCGTHSVNIGRNCFWRVVLTQDRSQDSAHGCKRVNTLSS